MDVIEDFVEILRVVLDYVGIDMDDMSEFLGSLNTRSRQALLHMNRAMVTRWHQSVTEPRVRMTSKWRLWRSDIRHRSLVRIIGTSLPLRPAKRLKIQSHLLRHQRRRDSCDSDISLLSMTSTVSSSQADLMWVEEDLGDNCIRVRAQKKDDIDDCDTSEDFDNDFMLRNEGVRSPMNSTMINSVSMVSSCDPAAIQKITAMEDELTALRNQMAMLVMMQEQVNKSQAVSSNVCATPTENSATPMSTPPGEVLDVFTPPLPPPPPRYEPLPPDSLTECLPPPPVSCGVPIPPPPPAVSVTPRSRSPQAISTPIQPTVLAVKMNPKNSREMENSCTGALTDILKGLGSVKLRSVQRSPGGTPLKVKQPDREYSRSDPAALIAQALKKKFAQQMTYSPDTDKENDNHDFSSSDLENSPHIIQGRTKMKRRSILFDDRRKSVGPLRDLNV
ncbi:mitochondrial fission regulator 2-like [Pecten maximus]|uniref:mitochondrial fission regulator 2-like n=1 Tax=Pecten maximus TaxID=6579 RepID=UPI001457F401|nr:mitochondrial fission regulator 2-like [Pecten maximus]XP_033736652.1 mitochondrial fission regulator 2-like [Pecten maximus]XP_033736653.1 mitochondrial fission regulator 2-like [Pecten maximus]XP_033736654.1 mitochondrial fission regulator 2-like [Pecten maximus]